MSVVGVLALWPRLSVRSSATGLDEPHAIPQTPSHPQNIRTPLATESCTQGAGHALFQTLNQFAQDTERYLAMTPISLQTASMTTARINVVLLG